MCMLRVIITVILIRLPQGTNVKDHKIEDNLIIAFGKEGIQIVSIVKQLLTVI